MARDVTLTLEPGQTLNQALKGDYIYCKYADRPVIVALGEGPVAMESGDKYRPRPFDSFTVENRDKTRPLTVVLTVGQGDFNRQIVQGELTTKTGIYRADGTFQQDTRFDIDLFLGITDDTREEYAEGDLVRERDNALSGNSSDDLIYRRGLIYHFEGGSSSNSYTLTTVDPVTLAVIDTIFVSEAPGELSTLGVRKAFYDPASDVFYITRGINDQCFVTALSFLQFTTGGAEQYLFEYDMNERLGGVFINGNDIAGYFYKGLFNAQHQSTDVIYRLTLQGELIDSVSAPDTVHFYQGTEGTTRTGDPDHGLAYRSISGSANRVMIFNFETRQFVAYADPISAQVVGNASPGVYSPLLGALLVQDSSLGLKAIAPRDYVIGGFATTGTEGVRLVQQVSYPNLAGSQLQNLEAGRYLMTGPLLKTLLANYVITKFGQTLGEDYLDHVFRLVLPNGGEFRSGSTSFLGAEIPDDFEAVIPGRFQLTIDNDLPRG